MDVKRALAAEAIGSFLLFATVIGSGVMAERLAGGNLAVALLGNTAATAAMLFVLITLFAPLSGAHFNPAVSLVFALRGELAARRAAAFVLAQLGGGIGGALAAHAMFGLPLVQRSLHARHSSGELLGEVIATFALLLTILGTLRHRPAAVPAAVALVITAGYWFTSSTSFANPAITVARSLTDSFSGIAPADVPGFIAAQLGGALLGLFAARLLFPPTPPPDESADAAASIA